MASNECKTDQNDNACAAEPKEETVVLMTHVCIPGRITECPCQRHQALTRIGEFLESACNRFRSYVRADARKSRNRRRAMRRRGR